MGFGASRYARPAPLFGSSMYYDRPDVYNRMDYDYQRPYGSPLLSPYSSGLPSYYGGIGAPTILPTPMAAVSPMASTVPFAPMSSPMSGSGLASYGGGFGSGMSSYGGGFGPGLSSYGGGLGSYQPMTPSYGCCPPNPGSCCPPSPYCPPTMTCQQGVLKIPCVCMVPQPPPQQIPVPQPYPVLQQVPVPQPYPVVQTQQVPVPTPVAVPQPVPTPVYIRGPSVPVPVPQPVQVPVYIRSPPVCIPVPTPVPVPCPCPVPVCPPPCPPVYPCPPVQPCPPAPSNLCCHPYTPASAYACC